METNTPEFPAGTGPAMHFVIRPAIRLGTGRIDDGHLPSPCLKKYGNVRNVGTLAFFQGASSGEFLEISA
jgi:hypothetical protein